MPHSGLERDKHSMRRNFDALPFSPSTKRMVFGRSDSMDLELPSPSNTFSARSIAAKRRGIAEITFPAGVALEPELVPADQVGSRAFLRNEAGQLFLNPHCRLRLLLDALVWALCLYCLVAAPFDAAFGIESNTLRAVDLLFDAVFLVDVAAEFRTAAYNPELNKEGYLVDAKVIGRRYLRGSFLIDAASSLPLELFVLGARHEARHYVRLPFKLLRYFRLRDLGRGDGFFHLVTSRVVLHVVRILRLLVQFLMLNHWVACILFAITRTPNNEPVLQTWAVLIGIEDAWTSLRYSQSLFVALSLTTGIGNTPVQPQLEREIVGFSVSMILGSAFWAFAVSSLFDLIGAMNRGNNMFLEELDRLAYWLEFRKIPPELQMLAMRHFNYQWERSRFIDESAIVSHLSPSVRLQLRRHQCASVVSRVPLFQNAPPAFIDEIVQRLQPRYVPEGEIVCVQGEVGYDMYIVDKGSVEILKQRDAQPEDSPERKHHVSGLIENTVRVAVLEAGSFFGEIALIEEPPTRRIATCRAILPSDLFLLTKADFNAVMDSHPEQLARVKLVADERTKRTSQLIQLSDGDGDEDVVAAVVPAVPVAVESSIPSGAILAMANRWRATTQRSTNLRRGSNGGGGGAVEVESGSGSGSGSGSCGGGREDFGGGLVAAVVTAVANLNLTVEQERSAATKLAELAGILVK